VRTHQAPLRKTPVEDGHQQMLERT
jgi:hypothetical protein